MSPRKLLILNGPGLADLDDIQAACAALCQRLALELEFRQVSNGAAVRDGLVTAGSECDALIVNPGAVAAESLGAVEVSCQSFIELHPDNLFTRVQPAEPLRLPNIKTGLVCGLGVHGYLLAIRAIAGEAGATDTNAPSVASKVRVINGPNLNLLGTREPALYGSDTLQDIAERCVEKAARAGIETVFLQSNHEGEIVEWIQQAINDAQAIVINAGAYTHTSVAIHDALRAFQGYTLELHISNPHQRESFRHTSYVSLAADAVVVGLGATGYDLVIELLPHILNS